MPTYGIAIFSDMAGVIKFSDLVGAEDLRTALWSWVEECKSIEGKFELCCKLLGLNPYNFPEESQDVRSCVVFEIEGLKVKQVEGVEDALLCIGYGYPHLRELLESGKVKLSV